MNDGNGSLMLNIDVAARELYGNSSSIIFFNRHYSGSLLHMHIHSWPYAAEQLWFCSVFLPRMWRDEEEFSKLNSILAKSMM